MTHNLPDLWQQVLKVLSSELNNDISFNTFLKPTKLLCIEDDIAIVEVPNDFLKEVLEKRYSNLLKDILSSILNRNVSIFFKIDSSTSSEQASTIDAIEKDSKNYNEEIHCNLNSKYTFDTFVVGNSNRFAHAASLAVAQAPAKAYNPLFIYGGVGLGKTHLMHAIGHYILEHNPSSKVMYVSSEK